ncbi:MAG: hypothetical protein K8R89_03990 [Anaerolineae bacterium]|nr:hypothetical protein [Anaerolineae bacterium]
MRYNKWKRLLSAVGLILVGMVVGWLFPMPNVQALRHIALSEQPYRFVETTLIFHRLCSELLPSTPLGQHYLDLGHTHWNQLGMLLWYDEATVEQTWRVIDLYSPDVDALLDGEGSTVRVSQEMVDELLYFLSKMESRADAELRQIIQDERARVPWHEIVGLTVAEAWIKLQETVPEKYSP